MAKASSLMLPARFTMENGRSAKLMVTESSVTKAGQFTRVSGSQINKTETDLKSGLTEAVSKETTCRASRTVLGSIAGLTGLNTLETGLTTRSTVSDITNGWMAVSTLVTGSRMSRQATGSLNGLTLDSMKGFSSKTINTATESTRIKTRADIWELGLIISSTGLAFTSRITANATTVVGAMVSRRMSLRQT